MSDDCFASSNYNGDVNKCCFLLRDKIEVTSIKKSGQNKLLLIVHAGSMEDLQFLKSLFELEGIFLSNVRNEILNYYRY